MQKLEFLTKIAQTAYDSAKSELDLQLAAAERMKALSDAGPIAISAIGQAQRQLNAAQAKFKILADFPGIKVDETKLPTTERQNPQ